VRLDLYAMDVTGVALAALCGDQQEEAMEGPELCVVAGRIAGIDGGFVLGHSTNPAATPLRFTGAELRAAGIDTS
jgi:hypothetical protein